MERQSEGERGRPSNWTKLFKMWPWPLRPTVFKSHGQFSHWAYSSKVGADVDMLKKCRCEFRFQTIRASKIALRTLIAFTSVFILRRFVRWPASYFLPKPCLWFEDLTEPRHTEFKDTASEINESRELPENVGDNWKKHRLLIKATILKFIPSQKCEAHKLLRQIKIGFYDHLRAKLYVAWPSALTAESKALSSSLQP